jgi:hypothetical protein
MNAVGLLLGAFGLGLIVTIYYVWVRKPSQASGKSAEHPRPNVG